MTLPYGLIKYIYSEREVIISLPTITFSDAPDTKVTVPFELTHSSGETRKGTVKLYINRIDIEDIPSKWNDYFDLSFNEQSDSCYEMQILDRAAVLYKVQNAIETEIRNINEGDDRYLTSLSFYLDYKLLKHHQTSSNSLDDHTLPPNGFQLYNLGFDFYLNGILLGQRLTLVDQFKALIECYFALEYRHQIIDLKINLEIDHDEGLEIERIIKFLPSGDVIRGSANSRYKFTIDLDKSQLDEFTLNERQFIEESIEDLIALSANYFSVDYNNRLYTPTFEDLDENPIVHFYSGAYIASNSHLLTCANSELEDHLQLSAPWLTTYCYNNPEFVRTLMDEFNLDYGNFPYIGRDQKFIQLKRAFLLLPDSLDTLDAMTIPGFAVLTAKFKANVHDVTNEIPTLELEKIPFALIIYIPLSGETEDVQIQFKPIAHPVMPDLILPRNSYMYAGRLAFRILLTKHKYLGRLLKPLKDFYIKTMMSQNLASSGEFHYDFALENAYRVLPNNIIPFGGKPFVVNAKTYDNAIKNTEHFNPVLHTILSEFAPFEDMPEFRVRYKTTFEEANGHCLNVSMEFYDSEIAEEYIELSHDEGTAFLMTASHTAIATKLIRTYGLNWFMGNEVKIFNSIGF
ncbi:hypothetical protein AB4254_09385 [Vibrio breoganii]